MRTARRGSVSPLGDLLGRQLDGMQMTRRIQEHTAPLIWADVVGAQVARATEIIGVENGVLRVSCKSAVWANELTFYKADIVRRLNARLGGGADPVIRDVLFLGRGLQRMRQPETEPSPPPSAMDLSARELATVEVGIASVREDSLRDRMRRARIAELQLRTWRLDNGWVPCARCGDLAPPCAQGDVSCPRCRLFGKR